MTSPTSSTNYADDEKPWNACMIYICIFLLSANAEWLLDKEMHPKAKKVKRMCMRQIFWISQRDHNTQHTFLFTRFDKQHRQLFWVPVYPEYTRMSLTSVKCCMHVSVADIDVFDQRITITINNVDNASRIFILNSTCYCKTTRDSSLKIFCFSLYFNVFNEFSLIVLKNVLYLGKWNCEVYSISR